MKKSTNNQKGFSISEMLMVVLILSLIVVIIGGGVVVIKDTYQKITLKAEAQTLLSTTITKVKDEFRFATEVQMNTVTETSQPVVSFVSGNNQVRITFSNDPEKGIMVGNTVDDQKVPLLTNKTLTGGLVPSIDYTYDTASKLFTATITIKNSKNITIASQEIKVNPINEE